MLRAQLEGRSRRTPKHHGNPDLPATHVEQLGGAIDDLIQRQDGEVEGHELDDGPEAEHGRAHSEPRETELADGGVHDPLVSEALEQALGDLVGAVVLGHLLTQEENGVVSLHLLGEGLVQRVSIRQFCHWSLDYRPRPSKKRRPCGLISE